MNKGVSKQFHKKPQEVKFQPLDPIEIKLDPKDDTAEYGQKLDEFANTLSPDAQKEVDRINFVESFNPQPKKGKK